MLASLRFVPPFPPALIPPISASLMAAVPSAIGFNLAVDAVIEPGVAPGVLANLSAMAAMSAALRATMGVSLAQAVSLPAVSAQLTASIQSFNAGSGALMPQLPLIAEVTANLAGLAGLAGFLQGVHAAFGIDLRVPGAIALLQARLLAPPLPVMAAAQVSVSAVPSLMAALGFKADAAGALAVGALASATAQMIASLPPLTNLNLLALLASLLPMLDTIKLALQVDPCTPNALPALQASLAALPLANLAALSASISMPLPLPTVSLAASVAANAAAGLDLSAVAAASLAPLGPLAMLMPLTASATLGMPPGECGQPCPLALLKAPPSVELSAHAVH